jgi:hypothetical protein
VIIYKLYDVGVCRALPSSHKAPSHGSRLLTSALVSEKFDPVAMLQKRSMRKTFQKTRRRSSRSIQVLAGGRNAIRLMSCSAGRGWSSSSTLNCSCSTVRVILPTMDQAEGPRPLPIYSPVRRVVVSWAALTVSKARITSACKFSTENDSILCKMTVCLLSFMYEFLMSGYQAWSLERIGHKAIQWRGKSS